MKRALAVAVLFFSFAILGQAQQLDPNQPWQNVQNMLNNLQQQNSYNGNYLLQQYYSPQNQLWQQMQEQNTFQQQYQYQTPTWNSNGYTPYSSYMYQNGYEPEVYAPQIYEPSGNVLLEPGDDPNEY